jgi:transcriptional regulator with XRE-family HTH domain
VELLRLTGTARSFVNVTSPGERLASIRRRRGLTQRELAESSGVSLAAIRKLEQGERESARLATLHKLAKALRVQTSSLSDGPDAAPAREPDVAAWEPVRFALEGRPDPVGAAEEPGQAGTEAAFSALIPLLLADRYDEVRGLLPALLRDADALVATAPPGHDTAARRLRSQARQVTALLMSHTWQFDAAADAVRLALDDAADPHVWLGAADQQCWGLIRAGDLAETRELAARLADHAEPRMTRASQDDLAAWGRLLIRLSTAAARDNRPGEAADALKYAAAAAVACGRDIRVSATPWDLFGPAAVAVIEVENAVIRERPEEALTAAERIMPGMFAVPRYWYRHRLDVARACVMLRRHGDAVQVLEDIRRAAPEWLVQQRYARDTLGLVLERRRTLTAEMRQLADAVGMPM